MEGQDDVRWAREKLMSIEERRLGLSERVIEASPRPSKRIGVLRHA